MSGTAQGSARGVMELCVVVFSSLPLFFLFLLLFLFVCVFVLVVCVCLLAFVRCVRWVVVLK